MGRYRNKEDEDYEGELEDIRSELVDFDEEFSEDFLEDSG